MKGRLLMTTNKEFNNNDSNSKQMSQEMNQIQEEFMQSLDDKQFNQYVTINNIWNEALAKQDQELTELENENKQLLSLLRQFNKQLTDHLPS